MRNLNRSKLLCRSFVWVFRSIRELFTHRCMEISQLPMSSAKIDLYPLLRFFGVSHMFVYIVVFKDP